MSKRKLNKPVKRPSSRRPCRYFLVGAAILLLPLAAARAQSGAPGIIAPAGLAAPDKSGYTLFQSTPREFMRELSTDRPDKTESPYTVDVGHLQLEMDFANFTASDLGGVRSRAWNIAPINLKIGLLDQVDLQFIFDGYLRVRMHDDKARPATMTQSGVGDFTTRLKINLWGDDHGATAFALLPFIKFPTNTNGLGNNTIEAARFFLWP